MTGSSATPHRAVLLDEVLVLVNDMLGDPTGWNRQAVTAVMIGELSYGLRFDDAELREVHDLLRGFIGFCSALHQTPMDSALHSLEDWTFRLGFAVRERDRRWHEPMPLERHQLDSLRRQVGSQAALLALTDEPLPDEPFDWSVVPAPSRALVTGALSLVDGACERWFDVEIRTAARRLAARVVVGDPGLLAAQPDPAASAAALVWLVARSNDRFGKDRLRVRDLMAHFDLAQASPAARAERFARAAGLEVGGYPRRTLSDPGLLTGARRREIVQERDRCIDAIGVGTPMADLLQVAHGASGYPGAPAASQRAAAPRGAG